MQKYREFSCFTDDCYHELKSDTFGFQAIKGDKDTYLFIPQPVGVGI